MKFTIRDILWLTLVAGLVLGFYVEPWINGPDYIMCPCCGSMYDLDTMRQMAEGWH